MKKCNVGANFVRPKINKGITLIALVITIIIMLILVAVTVSYSIKSGLIKKAQTGSKDTISEYQKETNIDNSMKVGNKSLGEYLLDIENNKVNKSTITIGTFYGKKYNNLPVLEKEGSANIEKIEGKNSELNVTMDLR